MSVSDEVPHQWHPFFEARGFESFHDLAKASKVAVSTVIATLRAEGRSPKDGTVAKVADALGTTAARVRELRGDPVLEPFTLPSKADQLDPTERRAVLTVVDALLRARGASHASESHAPADSSAQPRTPDEAGPAQVGRVIDVAFPPEHDPTLPPDINEVGVAAQQGQSEGRRLREQQDRDAEQADDETPGGEE